MQIKNAVALITGSSSGIGAATARLFAEYGCNVVINYSRNEAGAQKVADDCRALGVGDREQALGENWFPLQVAVLLSAPGEQFEGGEFVLTEQRPRRQSRAMVPPLRQGDALVFAVNQRPVAGQRGDYRVTLRHGVSELRRGERYTLGLIFHDAA